MSTLDVLDEPTAEPAARFGTQSLARGIRLMRAIASRPRIGWRLTDLALSCSLDRATARRMLVCMVGERLVHQRASDRHYLPGPLMFELGLALPDTQQFQRFAEDHLKDFARRLSGIALLQLRSGDDYVCSARVGKLALSGSMIYPGTRNPLCSAAGGMAILLTLDQTEQERVLANNRARELARHGSARLAGIERMLARSRAAGLALNLADLVTGVHALAVPIRKGPGPAFAALTILGAPTQYPEARMGEIRRELEATAGLLSEEAARLNVVV